MFYFRIRRTWQLQVKTRHNIHLKVNEGFSEDTLLLYVDDELVVKGKSSESLLKDHAFFQIDGRTHELRWIWGYWGSPKSILIMHKGRILAQYGNDLAAKDEWFESRD